MSEQQPPAAEPVFAFFYEQLQQARAENSVELDTHTEFYLVNLLTDFVDTRRLLESGGQRVAEQPLTIRLLASRQAPPAVRQRELKHLGDTTLYVLGFFAEYLRRSTVDRRYYQGLGEAAYLELAGGGLSSSPAVLKATFEELARKFSACVALLATIRDVTRSYSQDVLKLYEQYLATGSARLATRLRELGVLLDGPALPDPQN